MYDMIKHEDIIFVIITVSLFFQGFYFAKKQAWRVIIVSLILILSDLASVILSGDYKFPDAILHTSVYEIVIVIVYVVFWWGLGYITGYIVDRLVLIRGNDTGKAKRIELKEQE